MEVLGPGADQTAMMKEIISNTAVTTNDSTQANTYSDRARSQGASSDPGEDSLIAQRAEAALAMWNI
jgi:hypothetical protein